MLLILPLLFTIAIAERRTVIVQGNVYCQSEGNQFIPKATVMIVKSDRAPCICVSAGFSKFVNATYVDKRGKFNFTATVDQAWPGPATRVQIYIDCSDDNVKHCLKRFPTGEKCELNQQCERYTERAIPPTHYFAPGQEGSVRPYVLRNENLADMQFFLRESVACKASEFI